MKKIAVMTFGLLLAAGPAFAEAGLNQNSWGNSVGSGFGQSWDSMDNLGVGASQIYNSSGVITRNLNSGAASNVGAVVDVVATGGLSTGGGNTGVGSVNDNNQEMSTAGLVQVSAYNVVGDSVGQSYVNANSWGVNNVHVNGSQGIISQNANAGLASNVGSAIGVTIH